MFAYNNTGAVGTNKTAACQYYVVTAHRGAPYRVLFWVFRMSTTRTMSCWGIPSVMQTTRGISAAMASSIDAAATGGGTKIALRSL
jgi:hypothetical protein